MACVGSLVRNIRWSEAFLVAPTPPSRHRQTALLHEREVVRVAEGHCQNAAHAPIECCRCFLVGCGNGVGGVDVLGLTCDELSGDGKNVIWNKSPWS